MHRPLAVVLDILNDGVVEEKLIELFHHYTKPFSEGGGQRMSIEVVGWFEEFLLDKNIPEDTYPKLRQLLADKKAEHERSMQRIDELLANLA